MAEGDFAACKALLFGLDPVAEDVARWHDQGFSFASGPDATFPYGLQQRNGGPCGVLASAQGWLIRRALFPDIEQELLEGLAGLEAPPAVRKATPGIEAALASGRDGTAEPPSPVTGAAPSQAADSGAPVAAAAAAATAAAAAPPAPKQAGGLAAIRPTTQGARLEALSFALAAPLWQAALAPTPTGVERPPADVTEGPRVRLVFPAEPGASPITAASDASKLRVVDVHSFEGAWSLLHAALPELGRSHGVMCLVYSALLTRGVATVKAEMDEADTALVARFGHCNQEVVSLFLTGSATSNPFDGERPLFEGSEAAGLAVRGVSRPPPVGYLTQLEAMRYTEVGSFFKNPTSPVWVVGSTSHFTVLFCTDLACNLPDPSMRARRVFDKHDTTSGGMVALEDVPGILGELNLPVASQPMQTRAVVARMDKGIGMAVWTDFWEATRKMLVTLPAGEAPLAIVDEAAVEASAKAAFTASDEFGGGFVQLERVPAVLRALGKPAPTSCLMISVRAAPAHAAPRPPARPPAPHSGATLARHCSPRPRCRLTARPTTAPSRCFRPRLLPSAAASAVTPPLPLLHPHWPIAREAATAEGAAALEAQATKVRAKASDGIVFFEALWDVVGEDLVEHARATEQAKLDAEAAAADEQLAAALAASMQDTAPPEPAAAPPALAPVASRADKRPRSDSDIARELDAQMNPPSSAAMPPNGTSSSPVPSAGSAASTAPVPADAPAAGPALGRESSLQEDIRNLYGEQRIIRQFDLFHVNGLEDKGGRRALCTRASVRQTESGLVTELATADVANGSDARSFEGVVRTKWPGCMVSYPDGVAPKLN
ncbi:MINDY3 [Symbiodinium sp. KB8]|nr:MINDY3 [Symbiodinium sp. KB8]